MKKSGVSFLLAGTLFFVLSTVVRAETTAQASGSGTAGAGNSGTSAQSNTTPPPQVMEDLSKTVPTTRVIDFGSLPGGTLNLSSFVNQGSVYAVSSNPGITTAVIQSSGNIVNSGILTTQLPAAGLLGFTNLVQNLSLSLIAGGGIYNSGQISSAGNLNLQAPVIMNINAPGAATASLMQAGGNLNINTSQIVNQSVMSSLTGNINITALAAQQNLVINNVLGSLNAANGVINVRNDAQTGAGNVTMIGGALDSRENNFFSWRGDVNINAGDIEGLLNITAGEAHVQTANGVLQLGNIDLSGDPTFFNTNGDVVINSPLVFHGQDLAVIASGNVITAPGAGAIDTSSTGNAGSITIVAGATLSVFGASGPVLPPSAGDTDSAVFVTSVVLGSGNIDLSSGTPISSLNSRSSGANGGTVTLVAGNTITLPGALTITTGGSGQFKNGDVRILAGAPGGNAITIGKIDTTGGSGTGGAVTVSATRPTVSGAAPCAPCVAFVNGKIVYGSFEVGDNFLMTTFGGGAYPLSPALSLGNIKTGNIIAPGTAVTVQTGGALSVGSITDNGIGKSSGGNVVLEFVDFTNNYVFGGAGLAGATGAISVDGGPQGGDAGSIKIQFPLIYFLNSAGIFPSFSNPAGGSVDVKSGAFSLNSTSGNGGSLVIDMRPTTIVSWGVFGRTSPPAPISLNVAPGSISASAGGTGGAFNGGNIGLFAGSLNVSSPGNLHLSADGAGTGNGGSISLLTSSSLKVSNAPNEISLSAVSGSTGGAGGRASVVSVQNLTIDPLGLRISPRGANGNGGTISLQGSNIFVASDLNVNGLGNGNGGVMSINQTSAQNFSIGVNGILANGVNGATQAHAGASGGAGGTVNVTAGGAVNLPVSNAIDVSPTAGQGGAVNISAAGDINIGFSRLSADAAGGNYDGGTVSLKTTSGNVVSPAGANLVISANGSGTGNGGAVILQANALVIGKGNGKTSVTANGGSAGSSSGDGGSVSLFAGSSLVMDSNAVSFGPLGTTGKGGNFVAVMNSQIGSMNITGSISANGVGTGDGGSVRLEAAWLPIGLNAGAGVSGNVSADSGLAGGKAGSIWISSTNFLTTASLATGALSLKSHGGNGGSLRIEARVLTPSQTISVDGGGKGDYNGGHIYIQGPWTVTTPGTITFTANAVGNGNGGDVFIGIWAPHIGTASGLIQVQATGGSPGSNSGNGGSVNIHTDRIIVDPAGLNVSPLGLNGNGGSLSLGGGLGVPIYVSGGIDLSGHGVGDGGTFVFNGQKANVGPTAAVSGAGINGSVTADSGPLGGKGGSITIGADFFQLASGTLVLDSDSLLSVKSYGGKGGEINLSSAIDLSIPGGTLSADAGGAGNFDGGLISLGAQNRLVFTGGQLTLSAAGVGTGRGGQVQLSSAVNYGAPNITNNWVFGTGAGQINVVGASLEAFIHSGTLTVAPNQQFDGGRAFRLGITSGGVISIGDNVVLKSRIVELAAPTGLIQIGNNVEIEAGKLAPGTSADTPILFSSVVMPGFVDIMASDVQIGKSATIVANGGFVAIGADSNLTIGQDLTLSARGGSVALVAQGDITLGVGAQITSTAWIGGGWDMYVFAYPVVSTISSNNGIYRILPNGYFLPLYTGGAIGLYAGAGPIGGQVTYVPSVFGNDGVALAYSGLFNYITTLDNMASQRQTSIQTSFPNGFTPGNNTLNTISGGILRVIDPNGGIQMGNTVLYSNGGIIIVDPPGPGSLTLNNAILTAIAPPPQLPILPSLSSGSGVQLSGKSAPLSVITIAEQIFNSSTIIGTDALQKKNTAKSKGGDDDTASSATILAAGSNVEYLASSCQIYSTGNDDDSIIMGEAGTTFSVGSSEELTIVSVGGKAPISELDLKSGKLFVSTGQKSLAIATVQGLVNIPANTTGIVEQNKNGVVRVINADQDGNSLSISPSGSGGNKLSIKHGEEIVLADADTSDEELIPADGADRTILEAHILASGKTRTQRSKLDTVSYFKNDKTFSCASSMFATTSFKKLGGASGSGPKSPSNSASPSGKNSTPFKMKNDPILPISYQQSFVGSPRTDLRRMTAGGGTVRHTEGAQVTVALDKVLHLSEGEVLLESGSSRSVVRCGEYNVELAPDTVALVTTNSERDYIDVCNLSDSNSNSVKVFSHEPVPRLLGIAQVGQELCIGKSRQNITDKLDSKVVARRRTKFTNSSGLSICHSEISLVSLFNNANVLKALAKSDGTSDKRLRDNILKMAAILHLTTSRHGQFSTTFAPETNQ